MSVLLVVSIAYILCVVFVCLKILYGVHSTTKTFAYLLITLFVPVIGILVYLAVGANYRKNKLYTKKIINDDRLLADIRRKIIQESQENLDGKDEIIKSHSRLAHLLLNDNSPLTNNNGVRLLLNGETKFPVVVSALREAS